MGKMKRKILLNIILILSVIVGSSVCYAAKQNLSAPQKKLDKILNISWSDGNLIRFLLHREGHAKSEKYDKLFTAKLLKTLAYDEKIVVRENCDNQYFPGERCGLDFNPLICSDKTYIVTNVQVIKENNHEAIYRYESNGRVVATYKMIKRHDEWLLDGVGCPTGKSYNFSAN